MFRTAASDVPVEDVDPAAPFRAPEKEFHQSPTSRIRVRMGAGKSKEILFAAGRNPGAATKILVQAILSTAFAEGIVFFAIFLAK